MKTHDDWHLISAYLDGALSPEEYARVRSHLDACADCLREMQSLRSTKNILAAMPRRDAPLSLLANLDRRLVRPSWGRRVLGFFSRPWIWAPAGAVAAAVFLGVWVGVRGSNSDELPLEPLMAAHSRYAQESLVPHGDLVASNFSAQLALYEGQE